MIIAYDDTKNLVHLTELQTLDMHSPFDGSSEKKRLLNDVQTRIQLIEEHLLEQSTTT